jgi:hypothetical protein
VQDDAGVNWVEDSLTFTKLRISAHPGAAASLNLVALGEVAGPKVADEGSARNRSLRLPLIKISYQAIGPIGLTSTG